MEHLTQSTEETKKLGQKFAVDLSKRTGREKNSAVVLALSGDLGSGKTTFVQGLALGLGIKRRIVSPTFMLMRQYKLKKKEEAAGFASLYHVDLYRLDEGIEREMENLGLKEIWQDPLNIVVIEWAEKAKEAIPQTANWITFANPGGEKREITIKNK